MAIVLNGTTGITNDGGYTGDGVVFADTTPANTLVTDTSGNVGVGTASPVTKLSVVNGTVSVAGSTSGSGVVKLGDPTDPIPYVGVYRAAAAAIATSGNFLNLGGYDGIAFTTGPNALSAQTERARIDSSGRLLVGTTSAIAKLCVQENSTDIIALTTTGTNTGYLYNSSSTGTSSAAFFIKNGNGVGSISCSTSATAYNTSSDYRLKNTIAPMTGALAKVALLKPCTYKWNADGSDGEGFIAHELQAVVPDCVTGEKDAVDAEGNPQYQGIDTSFLVATLTAAIQEQQAIITALTARVEALEGTQA